MLVKGKVITIEIEIAVEDEKHRDVQHLRAFSGLWGRNEFVPCHSFFERFSFWYEK